VILRNFGWAFGGTVLALAAATLFWGWAGLGVVLILAILEISLSFDNAVVNAGVLRRMSPLWQRIFLTVGVLVAVVGMRLVFPLLVVGLTAQIGPQTVIQLALDPRRTYDGMDYAQHLSAAHPAIAAFGGMFLLMIFLGFLFEENEISWLDWLEKPLQRIGREPQLPVLISLVLLLVTARLFAGAHAETVLLSGIAGLATFLAVSGLSEWFEASQESEPDGGEGEGDAGRSGPARARAHAQVAGKAAVFLFIYLEVLDASFSFDGVVGAFAVSRNLFQIALGLGIGALYIRSLTVYLVRRGTLDDYVYLEHGAHYAIGALAVILLISIRYDVPELVTGLIGVLFIASALYSSIRQRRADRAAEAEAQAGEAGEALPPPQPADDTESARSS